VTIGRATGTLSAVLCADWGKDFPKRSVYVADVPARVVRRVSADGWTAAGVLEEAERRSSRGSVLATFDAPLGVPESYLTAVSTLVSGQAPASFLELLARARFLPRFFDASSVATDWRVERPFFAVPPGKGGLRTYVDAAGRHRVDLHRWIDRVTAAKPVFITSGIPGSVGSAACALWQELALHLTSGRTFKIWPFEGDLQTLLQSTPVVVGEIYPRAAYATALLDDPADLRPALIVAKTDAGVRRAAIAALHAASWVRRLRVTLQDMDRAEANEDDFDACVTAAALLRCVLDGTPLCPSRLEAAMSEGGILGTGSVNLRLPSATFARAHRPRSPDRPQVQILRTQIEGVSHGAEPGNERSGTGAYSCPIAGCDKIFQGSRGGWDGHVGSVRMHPNWHPELEKAEARKRRFEVEFPDFFT
jgi:hypothetical protein